MLVKGHSWGEGRRRREGVLKEHSLWEGQDVRGRCIGGHDWGSSVIEHSWRLGVVGAWPGSGGVEEGMAG